MSERGAPEAWSGRGTRPGPTGGGDAERGATEARTHGHAAPFYCPYCGDEDIRPFGERHGEWRCGACRRVWGLRYVGVARAAAGVTEAAGMPAAAAELGPS